MNPILSEEEFNLVNNVTDLTLLNFVSRTHASLLSGL